MSFFRPLPLPSTTFHHASAWQPMLPSTFGHPAVLKPMEISHSVWGARFGALGLRWRSNLPISIFSHMDQHTLLFSNRSTLIAGMQHDDPHHLALSSEQLALYAWDEAEQAASKGELERSGLYERMSKRFLTVKAEPSLRNEEHAQHYRGAIEDIAHLLITTGLPDEMFTAEERRRRLFTFYHVGSHPFRGPFFTRLHAALDVDDDTPVSSLWAVDVPMDRFQNLFRFDTSHLLMEQGVDPAVLNLRKIGFVTASRFLYFESSIPIVVYGNAPQGGYRTLLGEFGEYVQKYQGVLPEQYQAEHTIGSRTVANYYPLHARGESIAEYWGRLVRFYAFGGVDAVKEAIRLDEGREILGVREIERLVTFSFRDGGSRDHADFLKDIRMAHHAFRSIAWIVFQMQCRKMPMWEEMREQFRMASQLYVHLMTSSRPIEASHVVATTLKRIEQEVRDYIWLAGQVPPAELNVLDLNTPGLPLSL